MTRNNPLPWLAMAQTEIGPADMAYLTRFSTELEEQLKSHPAQGKDLLQIKRNLATQGYGATDIDPALGGAGRRTIIQAAIQFLCGWHNIETRDAAGVAHGRLVLRHATPEAHLLYDRRITAGELVAICASEERGGTDIKGFQTTATPTPGGKWLLNGEKCHVSRIDEAGILVVFFKTPDNPKALSAAVIDAGRPGIRRETLQPSGLTGWSWGRIAFENVELNAADFLGSGPGDGLRIFHDHFAYFRPMVAAVALGAVARIFDEAVADLNRRKAEGLIDKVFDSTRQLLGEASHAIESELLYTLRIAATGAVGDVRTLTVKACAVDRAVQIGEKLERILGARGFRAESTVARPMNGLRALRYADGVHDRLLTAAGNAILRP